MSETNRKYLYVRKGKEGNPVNNILNGQLRAQVDPLIENLGNRAESRISRVRQRLQNIGIAGVAGIQPQNQEEPKKDVATCPSCGAFVTEQMSYCPSCRAPLTVAAKRKLEESNLFTAKQHTSVLIDT